MADNVVSIWGEPYQPPAPDAAPVAADAPNERVVAFCQRLLAMAESGELRGVATVQTRRSEPGGIFTDWCIEGNRISATTVLAGFAVIQMEMTGSLK